MLDWAYLFKTGIALFAIVNPIGSIPMFISATNGWSESDQLKTTKTVAITVFCVLAISALFGDSILDFFGISIASFQVGGGILLLLISISMMHAKHSGTRQTLEEAQAVAEREAIAIVPLSIPLLAGPGAISSMIIAAQQSGSFINHIPLILPIAAISLMIWGILRLSNPIAEKLGTIGINVVTRLMGLILAAMAVEFIANGLMGLFPKLAS
jgi:multiple antibiotic resistance protein